MLILFSTFCLVSIVNTRNSHATDSSMKRARSSNALLRVQEGQDIGPGEYPFVVILTVIMYAGFFYRSCTGSMITEDWGLTAAHCKNLQYKLYSWYGNFTQPPLTTKMYREVLEMITHPSYRWLSTDGGKTDLIVNNDICLFRVASMGGKQSFARLSSVDRRSLIGLAVTYVGAGSTTMTNLNADRLRPLQFGEGAIIPCDEEMSSKSKYIICVTPKCSKRMQRPWYGDSGGPLILEGQIIGVCSYGTESNVIVRAGYVPISPYTDWIYDVMHSKP